MAIRNVQYFFGRLNIIAIYDDKHEFMRQGFQGGRIIQARGSGWGFFEVNAFEDESGHWFEGYLVKYKPETEEEKVVLETQQIEDEAVRDRVVAKSRFFIHVDSGIIAYRPISNQISRKQFADNFVSVFRENHDFFFGNAELISIDEEYKILDILRRFTRIQEVKVSLHPSNPSNRDMWRRTDERLRNLGAASYQESIEANVNGPGLRVIEDEETTGKIAMAVDGYGQAAVTGTLDGEQVTINTEQNPITVQAPNDEAETRDIFRVLLQTFQAVKARFVDGRSKTNESASNKKLEDKTEVTTPTKEEREETEAKPKADTPTSTGGDGPQIIRIDDDKASGST